QFLKSLYDEKLLRLDKGSGEWQFNLERIRGMGITDNVVELMAGKIQKLSEETQCVLKLASCIGNQLDLNTLTIVNEKSLSQTSDDLWEAVREGLVIVDFEYPLSQPSPAEGGRGLFANSEFRFLHDGVQQAAYALIPDEEKKAVHLNIGRLMLRSYQLLEENTITPNPEFDIVNHLNLGSELITEESERVELARLNLAAGRKAKSSTAYQAALEYFNAGIALLKTQTLNPESRNSWDSDYDLMFALHLEAAECKYLCGHFEEAERDFDLLLERARTRLDKARVYNPRITQYENMSRYGDAVRCAMEGLALCGVSFPDSPGERHIALEAELSAIRALIGDRTVSSLIDLPIMKDPEVRMVMKLLTNMTSSAYYSGDKLLILLNIVAMVRLSLLHGNTEESAYGYVLHAFVNVVRGDYKSGHDFGMLALRLNERLNSPTLSAKVLSSFTWAVGLWRMPWEASFPYARESFRCGVETGLFCDAAYGNFSESWYAMLTGRDLGRFIKEYEPNLATLKKLRLNNYVDAQKVILNWALALQGQTTNGLSLSDGQSDESRFIQAYEKDPFFMTYFGVAKTHLYLTFEDYRVALDSARGAQQVVDILEGTVWHVLLSFLTGLSLAALYRDADEEERRSYLVELEATSGLLEVLAENCPENFLCWSLMLRAELARISGRDIEAMPLYEGAIRYAGEKKNLMNGALANELYA
ncbi:MAG: ATP-binding protein, partial [Thermodesulfobacteriota bacterium]